MNYALIADVHANLPALEAVLAHIDCRRDIDAVYHLGALVGYAPWPNEVVALLRERGIPGVAGNYDSTVATDHAHCGCKYEDPRQEALSHESYAWTRAHVSAETKRWLGGLCLKMAEHLGARAGDVIAFGHTHRPWHRRTEEMLFVNTGSVGRPKDGDWRAGYATVAFSKQLGRGGLRPARVGAEGLGA